MNQTQAISRRTLVGAVGAAVLAMGSASGHAMTFTFGEGDEWELDWDTTVSYAAQWRVAKRDRDQFRYKDLGGDDPIASLRRYTVALNADDGNNNFDRGMTQNKISVLSEIDLSWRNFGLFARGRAYYDDVYNNNTDLTQSDYRTYNNGFEIFDLSGNPLGDTAFRKFPDGTRDKHRDRVEMLDYFLYADGNLSDTRNFNIRLGSQVINWGEATFTPGINGLQNRADLIARNTPGAEVKEILLPTGALYGQVNVVPGVTFGAYYQYEWKKTELNGVGSYFGDRDFLGPGATNFLIALGENNIIGVPRTPDKGASDSGQWGIALNWLVGGDTDVGFYFINAHNKAPAYRLNYDGLIPDSYTIEYFEDIKGYAASFTTVMFETNVQGEVSFKTDTPVVLANGDPTEGDVAAYQLGGSYVFEPTRFWDDAVLVFELAGAYVTSHDSSELTFDDHGTVINLRWELSYFNIAPGLDLKVPIFIRRGLDGNILESEMVEDSTAFNITFQFVYLNNFTTEIGYTNYFDGGEHVFIDDRDNVSLNFSYSF